MAPPPDTRDTGEWPPLTLGNNSQKPSLSLSDIFTRNLSDYDKVLSNTKKVIQDVKNVESDARYFVENIYNNQDYTAAQRDAIMLDIQAGITTTNANVKNIGDQVENLSSDMSKLATRIGNTEQKLSIKPDAGTQIQTRKIQWVKDKTAQGLYATAAAPNYTVPPPPPGLFGQGQGQHHGHGYSAPPPPAASAATAGATPAPAQATFQPPPTQASQIQTNFQPPPGQVFVDQQPAAKERPKPQTQDDEIKPFPLVYYKGGINYRTVPEPHLQELSDRIKYEEFMKEALSSLDANTANRGSIPGGNGWTVKEARDYDAQQDELLAKLRETGGDFMKLLAMGRGGEGRVRRMLKEKCREVMANSGYKIDPRTRRVNDLVDGQRLPPELNWYLDTDMKFQLEEDLSKEDFSEIPAHLQERARLGSYHTRKFILGDILMSTWRDFDTFYGVDKRPMWLSILVNNHLTEKFDFTIGDVTALQILEITPLLGSFGNRYPTKLLVTARNTKLVEKLVDQYEEVLRRTNNKERRSMLMSATMFYPDECRDYISRLEARMNQLRKGNDALKKRTAFSLRWGGEHEYPTDIIMKMSVDGSNWEEIDTSFTRTNLISNRNNWRGPVDQAKMSNHHKRLLQTYRFNMNDTSARSSIKHLPALTQEQMKKSNPFVAAKNDVEVSATKTPERRVFSFGSGINSANGISTSFNFGANIQTSNRWDALAPITGPGKHKNTPPNPDREKAARTSTSTSGSISSVTDITDNNDVQEGGERNKGIPKNLSSENSSILRSNDSSDDEFEDAIQNLQECELHQESVLPVNTPTLLEENPTVSAEIVETELYVNLNDTNLTNVPNNDTINPEIEREGSDLPNVDTIGRSEFVSVDNAEESANVGKVIVNLLDNVDNNVSTVASEVVENNVSTEVVVDIPRESERINDSIMPGTSDLHTNNQPTAPAIGVANLKTFHPPPKLDLEFFQDNGRSYVEIQLNRELLNIWTQFWIECAQKKTVVLEGYEITTNAKEKGTTFEFSVKMRGHQGNGKQAVLTRLDNNKVRVATKSHHDTSRGVIGKILKPMIWEPLKLLQFDLDIKTEKEGEEGKRTCRMCESPNIEIITCECCGQSIHQKCSRERCCRWQSCGKIKVNTIITIPNKKLLEVKMGNSPLYSEILARMRRGYTTISESSKKKRRETEFNAIAASNKRKKTTPSSPVVVTRIQKLRDITNENVGVLGAQSILRNDKTKEHFKNRKLEPEKTKRTDTTVDPEGESEENKNKETVTEEVKEVETELKLEVRVKLNKEVCSDTGNTAGSFLRAVSAIVNSENDYSIPGSIDHFARTLSERIPRMKEASAWSENQFGGDNSAFQMFVKSRMNEKIVIDIDSNKDGILLVGIANFLKRNLRIYTKDTIQNGTPIRVNGGQEAQDRKKYDFLYEEKRFWALLDRKVTEELVTEVAGMRGPSQSFEGRAALHKVRGPTLPVKGRNLNTKAKKDEKRRRDEKAKSDKDLRLDALEKLVDSLKADNGELKDKLRNEESRARAQNKYIYSVEKRFSDLCISCKEKTPELAFTNTERYTLLRLMQLMEEQSERLDELTKKCSEAQPSLAPDTEKQVNNDNLTNDL